MNVISHKQITITLFLAAIITLMISGFIGYSQYNRAFRMNNNIITSYKTIRAANQSLLSINEAALEISTLLYAHNPEAIKNIPNIIVSAQVNLEALSQLTQDDRVQIQIFKKLKIIADKKISFLNSIISEYSAGNNESALKIASDKDRLQITNNIIQLIIEIKKIESSQLEQSVQESQHNKIRADNFFIFAGTFDTILFLLSFIFVRRYLQ